MRSVNTDPAAARNVEDWDQIPWPKFHGNVRRLQVRIAKATREQDWRRVKALQRFLVNSFSAKALAWACNDCQKCRFQTRICPCGQFSGRCLSPWWFGLATGGYSAASHFR